MFANKKRLFATALMSTALLTAMAQQAVTGNVKDTNGDPLIGVSVYVDGKPAAVTDIDGNFTIPGLKPTQKVRMSYLGYDDVNLQGDPGKLHSITMKTSDKVLDEVMVVGYGTMKKSDLTGSISSVGTQKLNEKGATSVVANLQGSVPGVNITQSTGRTGGGFNIEIRGKNSNDANQSPLYVVDGVICSDIDFLNPQDIERVDILKDASSTAIYGSRATAGVVIVTTKSGSNIAKGAQKPSITYDGYYGVSKASRLPDFMNGNEFYKYRFMKFLNKAGGDANGGQPVWVNDDLDRCLLKDNVSGAYRMTELLLAGKTYDWKDFVLQDGQQQNHYLAISGSNNKTNYHVGFGYTGEKGIYTNDKQDKFTIKTSVDTKVNSWLAAGASVNLARIDKDFASDDAVKNAFNVNPFMQPYDADGNINYRPGSKEALNTDMYQFSNQISPLILMQDQRSNRLTWTALGNIYLEAKPMKGLSLKTTFSPSYSHQRYGFYQGTEAGETQNTAKRSYDEAFSYTWDNQVTYDRMFGDDHHLNLMGLVSYTYANTEAEALVYNKVMEGTNWWNIGTTDKGYDYKNSSSSYSENKLMSYAVRANYTYLGRYLFTGTMRWDGSSRFRSGNRWGMFPSAAVAWRLSEEPFMVKAKDWLSNLKLRLSYGVTGNNSVLDYETMAVMGTSTYYPFGTAYSQGVAIGSIVDPDLKWEKSHEVNFGIDFGFLNERIRGSVDIYNKKSTDLLYNRDLPLVTAGATVRTNVGSVRNRGVEVSLTTTNIQTKDWNWETTFTFAHNSNKVLEINGTGNLLTGTTKGNLFIGKPYGVLYDYEWDGIVTDRDMVVPDNEIAKLKGFVPGETVKEYAYYNKCYGLVEGNPIIVDRNGDGKYDDNDKKTYNTDPKWTGSFTSNLSWKDFDFSFSLYAKQGNKVYSNFYYSYLGINDRGRNKLDMDWYIPAGTLLSCDGVNADGSYITPVYQETTHYGDYPFPNNGCGNGGLGTAYWLSHTNSITDGSFVKVKYITLGYSLPKSWLSKIGCQKFRIYCTVTNPFVFTKYKGYDPEWASADLVNDGPSTTTWQFGASIKF